MPFRPLFSGRTFLGVAPLRQTPALCEANACGPRWVSAEAQRLVRWVERLVRSNALATESDGPPLNLPVIC